MHCLIQATLTLPILAENQPLSQETIYYETKTGATDEQKPQPQDQN